MNETMTYDARYTAIAYMVLGELHVDNESYDASFTSELDYQRLGQAIQRAILLQQIHEIARVFDGKIPDADVLFPGMTIPIPEVTTP